MECPHVTDCVNITTVDENQPQEFKCYECETDKSLWICVSCGVVNCGRYMNGHALEHQVKESAHVVCMDCNTYAAYCYACDDFVVNDSEAKHLEQLRVHLRSINDARPKRKRQNSTCSLDENQSKKKTKNCNHKAFCKAKVAGLRNLGNTCFMNAVLQSLSNIQQFCCYFKQLPALEAKPCRHGKKHCVTRRCSGTEVDTTLLTEELRKTLISLWQGSKTAISPDPLFAVIWKVVPRFRGYQQQDAHEFLRYMLDRLHTELLKVLPNGCTSLASLTPPLGATTTNNNNNHNKSPPTAANSPTKGSTGLSNKSTIVTSIFGGILQNEVRCLVCGTNSKKLDPFLDLSLDIPQVSSIKSSRNKDDDAHSCHLLDCLNSFTELEELTETEHYLCHSCKRKQRSTKKFWLRRLPNVLCLHLKRFRWHNYYRVKLDNFVEFPLKGLDMNRFLLENMHETRGTVGGSSLYDLAAVIVHHGSGAGSGHYTAYATYEGCWHHFNDSSVTVTTEETVANSKAYILFYIRRELNLSPFSI